MMMPTVRPSGMRLAYAAYAACASGRLFSATSVRVAGSNRVAIGKHSTHLVRSLATSTSNQQHIHRHTQRSLARSFACTPSSSEVIVAPRPSYQRFMGNNGQATAGTQATTSRSRFKTWHIVLATTTAGAGVVYLTHLETVPITNRSRCILVSRKGEVEMGREAFAQVLNDAAAKKRLLPNNHPDVKHVKDVARRLVSGARKLNLVDKRDKKKRKTMEAAAKNAEDKQHRWRVAVIRANEPNAFALPGNHIVCTTALLDLYRGAPEDELAAVLGHEVAHVVCRHGVEKATKSMVTSAMLFTSVLFGDFILALLLSQATTLGINLPFSREMEREADHLGLKIAAAACYDPRGAINAHRRLHNVTQVMQAGMARGAGGRAVVIVEPPTVLSTHPPYEERVRLMSELMPEAQAEYARRDCEDKRARLFSRRRR